MSLSIAVITGALSNGFFFPRWHRYYGQVAGEANLYVVTYRGLGHHFAPYPLGGVWELPHAFDDGLHARVISLLVATLLESHDVVVRVDVDEFLVPDLRLHADLGGYLRAMTAPYVTARGFDVIQLADEPALDWSRPILVEQRRHAYANSSLNKTCVTSVPLTWSNGFHGCNGYPLLGDLLMLHLKWVDAPRLLDWYRHMTGQVGGDPHLEAYYRPEVGRIEEHRKRMSGPAVDGGWEAMRRSGFDATFQRGLMFQREWGIWEPPHAVEPVLLRLPDELRGVV